VLGSEVEHRADEVCARPAEEPRGADDPGVASGRGFSWLLLVGVEEALDPVLLPVDPAAEKVARVRAARDEHQLREPGLDASTAYVTIGRSYSGSTCLFVIRVGGAGRVPAPPARITPFIVAMLDMVV
jgi:hypothetical protein